ncbi:MAG: FAD binding domain-containing protein [Dehalococcoidales bacterium]|nr:FAD binding domain-containing protein [Dehalococcoidales bacterium]
MRKFNNINAKTLDEAVSALGQHESKAWICAGGTDLIGVMKDDILPEYPEFIVNLKTIPGLEYIKEEGAMLKIGALTKLEDIAIDSVVKSKYTALAQAAYRTASPHLREMGTIGGNICQMNRCWYFRDPRNTFYCIRKGGNMCFAMAGDNRYHSIFGAVQACVAVNPSDMAPALVALDASIVTTKRTIAADDFWDVKIPNSTVLDEDEIVTEIRIPEVSGKSAFIKFAIRKSIDFPIVNCAANIGSSNARICLNAVYNKPYRATKAEDAIAGKSIDEANAEAAGSAAVSGSTQLAMNKYKIQIAKTMVKRAILACA